MSSSKGPSWTHQVRIAKHDGTCVTVYCTSEDRGLLRSVGDIDTAPGQRVAERRGNGWECVLSWAQPKCLVKRRGDAEDPALSALIIWRRTGNYCQPWRVKFSADDAEAFEVTYEQLQDRGLVFPASKAPYRRMASLTPEERKAYHTPGVTS